MIKMDGIITKRIDNVIPLFREKSIKGHKDLDKYEKNIKDQDKVYRFKVEDLHNKRSFNIIELKGNQKLHDLHKSILEYFDELEEGHLYSFFMNNNRSFDDACEYTSPDGYLHTESADKVKIHELDLYLKHKFLYVYNFSNESRFEIQFIQSHDM